MNGPGTALQHYTLAASIRRHRPPCRVRRHDVRLKFSAIDYPSYPATAPMLPYEHSRGALRATDGGHALARPCCRAILRWDPFFWPWSARKLAHYLLRVVMMAS